MKRTMILIIGIFILISCKEQKRQVEKFLFDASKVSNKTKYFYKYDSEKLISQTEKNYTIMFGQVVDSTIYKTDFKYDKKGLLIKEISQTTFEERPTIKIYNYDVNDSLISEMIINPQNDTTLWQVYNYYPDGRKTVFHRFLSMHIDPNQDFIEAIKNGKLDTSFFRNEFDYVENFCKTQRKFDLKGNLISTVNFDYIGNKLLKETYLTYYKELEIIEKVKSYNYTKSDIKPDFYSLDSKNDTIELCVNEFSKGLMIASTLIFEYGRNINKIIYENGKKVVEVGVNLNENYRIVDSYEYYENGDLKENKSYNEKIEKGH